jgi:hypothetical protein
MPRFVKGERGELRDDDKSGNMDSGGGNSLDSYSEVLRSNLGQDIGYIH